MLRALQAYWREQDGMAALEYTLLTSTISLGSIAVWARVGHKIAEVVTRVAEAMD